MSDIKQLRKDCDALAAAINPLTRKNAPDHLTMAAAAKVLALQAEAIDAQAAEIERLRSLCAAAYQVVGVADGPLEMLDNLWGAGNGRPLPHEPMAGIPWMPTPDAEIARLRDALQRIASSLDESYLEGSMERTLGDCARAALTPQQPAPNA